MASRNKFLMKFKRDCHVKSFDKFVEIFLRGGEGGIRTHASRLKLKGLANPRNGPTMRPLP